MRIEKANARHYKKFIVPIRSKVVGIILSPKDL